MTDRGAVCGAGILDLGAAKVARIGRSISGTLESGYVIANSLGVGSTDEWRKAARREAATHGWKLRTGVTPDGVYVWAVRLDRGTTEADRARFLERLGYVGALLADR